MEYYIDETETKQEEVGKGRFVTLYRCGCRCCEKCWFNPLTGHCVAGGPYGGYEEVKDGESS